MEDVITTLAEEREARPVRNKEAVLMLLSVVAWIYSLKPELVPDCLQNLSATSSRCSSLETASQLVSGTWFLHHATQTWQSNL
jgi:hypothetical protein